MNTTAPTTSAATPAKAASPAAAPAKNKNWLMASTRKWHIWLGVATALFLGFFFLSGIVLAHKDIFKPEKVLETSSMIALDFTPLTSEERSVLKALKEREEKEKKYLRLKRMEERRAAEAAVAANPQDAAAVATLASYGMDKEKKEHGPREKKEKREKMAGMDMKEKKDYDDHDHDHDHDHDEKDGKYKDAAWWKVMKDLHTGKFLAGNWTYFNDVISIIGIFLTISGVYLWAVAKIRQAENSRKAKAAAAAKAAASAAPAVVAARPAPQVSQPAPAAGE